MQLMLQFLYVHLILHELFKHGAIIIDLDFYIETVGLHAKFTMSFESLRTQTY